VEKLGGVKPHPGNLRSKGGGGGGGGGCGGGVGVHVSLSVPPIQGKTPKKTEKSQFCGGPSKKSSLKPEAIQGGEEDVGGDQAPGETFMRVLREKKFRTSSVQLT